MDRRPARRFLERVAATVAAHEMIPGQATVLVAFSGGADSTALLHALWSLRKRLRCRLRVCHVHHGLRGEEADADADHAARVTRSLRLPFIAKRADVRALAKRLKLSLETAARHERYRLLGEAADELSADRIATGHTADDQAETVLLNLVRGTGPEGLAGIPPVREAIIRPLLQVSRAEVEEYCQTNGLVYRSDSSNQNLAFTRNRIRHQVLPRLRAIQPAIVRALCRLAEIARGENAALDHLVCELLPRLAVPTPLGLELGIPSLLAFPVGFQRRILRAAIAHAEGDEDELGMDHIEALVEMVASGRTGATLRLPGGLQVERSYQALIISGGTTTLPLPGEIWRLEVPGKLDLPEFGVSLTAVHSRSLKIADDPSVAVLDEAMLSLPLVVRGWRPGDRFVPLGMKRHKKLQDFFVDQKVPARTRRRIPLVLSGDEIVWVVGHRISDRHKVTGRTRRTVRLTATPTA